MSTYYMPNSKCFIKVCSFKVYGNPTKWEVLLYVFIDEELETKKGLETWATIT
jgi:hypothetical protein